MKRWGGSSQGSVSARTGVHYNDGEAKNVAASETGWFLDAKKQDAITEKKICITPYARTGACEDKYSMTGHIKVLERITIW
jgi:hypothetical protein